MIATVVKNAGSHFLLSELPASGGDVVVKYVLPDPSLANAGVLAAVYTQTANGKTLSDVAISSAAPVSALVFDGASQPATPYYQPYEYTMQLTVPACAEGETVTVSTFAWNSTALMQPLTASVTFPVQ